MLPTSLFSPLRPLTARLSYALFQLLLLGLYVWHLTPALGSPLRATNGTLSRCRLSFFR